MFTRLLNVVLLVILAFIAGAYTNANWNEIRCACLPQPAVCDDGCCDLKPKHKCGCPGCDGKCLAGKGACSCDAFNCMDKTGCNCKCPGK